MDAMKQFGVIRVMAFLRFSILKWWYSTNSFSCWRLRIIYSPFECVAFSMIPLSRKHAFCSSIILVFKGLNLYWFVTKSWVGFAIVNSDPSNSIKEPLVWDDGVLFVNIIFQSTCHAWNCLEKWEAPLASQLIMSCYVCFEFWWRSPPLALALLQKMLAVSVGWSLSSKVIGSML